MGLQVLIVGTTCKNCNYHLYGIGVLNEKPKDFKLMFEAIKEGISILYDEIFKPNIFSIPNISSSSCLNDYYKSKTILNHFLSLVMQSYCDF